MKLGSLSREELKALIKEAVEEALVELLGDPDEGFELRPEVRERLQRSLERVRQGRAAYRPKRWPSGQGWLGEVLGGQSVIFEFEPLLPCVSQVRRRSFMIRGRTPCVGSWSTISEGARRVNSLS